MSTNCSTSNSYFDTPEFLTSTLHTMTLIELPIHLFGAYCILFKTPKKMEHVKWTMLNTHVWTALLDVSISGLVTPFLAFPATAGTTLGLLSYLGLHTVYQTYYNFSVAFILGSSIVALFEGRYNLFMESATWNRYRYAYHIINYVCAVTVMFPQLTFLLPDQDEARETYRHFYPCCCPDLLASSLGLKLSADVGYFMAVLLIYNGYLIVTGGFFALSVPIYLRTVRLSSTLSKTLHSRIQFAVMLQTTIPMTSLVFTTSYAIFSVKTGYHNQGMTNIAVVLACLHGLLSTITMLLIHEPYRNFLCKPSSALQKVFTSHNSQESQQVGSLLL